jgi:hypothetical protein
MTRSSGSSFREFPSRVCELLALALRPAHHDLPAAERVEVEGMERVAERERMT